MRALAVERVGRDDVRPRATSPEGPARTSTPGGSPSVDRGPTTRATERILGPDKPLGSRLRTCAPTSPMPQLTEFERQLAQLSAEEQHPSDRSSSALAGRKPCKLLVQPEVAPPRPVRLARTRPSPSSPPNVPPVAPGLQTVRDCDMFLPPKGFPSSLPSHQLPASPSPPAPPGPLGLAREPFGCAPMTRWSARRAPLAPDAPTETPSPHRPGPRGLVPQARRPLPTTGQPPTDVDSQPRTRRRPQLGSHAPSDSAERRLLSECAPHLLPRALSGRPVDSPASLALRKPLQASQPRPERRRRRPPRPPSEAPSSPCARFPSLPHQAHRRPRTSCPFWPRRYRTGATPLSPRVRATQRSAASSWSPPPSNPLSETHHDRAASN